MMSYLIEFEVAGPLAIFTRPDSGGVPSSYPVPTWSACKGLFEAIAFLSSGSAWICPIRVEVCKRKDKKGGNVRFQSYVTNYGGPLRKPQVAGKGANMQLFATVLADVCYRLYAQVRGRKATGGVDSRHQLQEIFQRRLANGQCHHTPALGWREFTCSYWGKFRSEYVVDSNLNLTIPSMLVTPWDRSVVGNYAHRFVRNVRVDRGVLNFAE